VLIELRVENYAVIDNLVVEFAPGLNLLTGETGAGKSLLVDALALLLGEKASPEVVRHGAEKAVVAAVFEADARALASVLQANGIDADDAQLIIRREIASGGRGRVFVNNQPATVAVLKQLAPHLAGVHAQSESIVSFDAAVRLELLDAFAGNDLASVADAFTKWKGVRERIAELERDEQDRLRLVDLWSFQKREIAEANLQPEEDQRLEFEKRVLANAERIYSAAMTAYDSLYDSSNSAGASLRAAARQVEELARFDAKFHDIHAQLESARITAEDIGTTLRDYAEGIEASPERLAQVEDRLALIERLKRKYGQTVADVIAFGAEVGRKLDEMENKDEVLRRLRAELAEAAAEYLRVARALSKARFDAARKLEKLVETEVNDLAMKVRFHIELSGSDEENTWTPSGFDEARYLITTNPGEPLRPIEEIASGGELSRVMLALKVSADRGNAPRRRTEAAQRTLVFDEIDTGIGGRAAEAVGRKLKALAAAIQVLCVTHLPQIASFADHHYVIAKKEAGGRTRTSIRRLTAAERTEEVARMLSGAKLTDASRKNAEQLLKANA
jgi:DNA repair protein RecN (Recombination protein N)